MEQNDRAGRSRVHGLHLYSSAVRKLPKLRARWSWVAIAAVPYVPASASEWPETAPNSHQRGAGTPKAKREQQRGHER